MTSDPVRLGLVHTVPALGAVFHALVVQESGSGPAGVEPIHVTDPWLLKTAVSAGITPEVVDRLSAHVEHLVQRGSSGVLVTCSSLGEATEDVARRLGSTVPIVRVDQGMADHAVDVAGDKGRIMVLATVASTVGPTVRLVERSAQDAGFDMAVDVEVLDEAGRARESGDSERHDALVAGAVARWASKERADVVVLAQASMAQAATGAAERGEVPVLSSPELAARRLISVTRDAS